MFVNFKDKVIIVVYVDDLLLFRLNLLVITKVKKSPLEKFDMTNLGDY